MANYVPSRIFKFISPSTIDSVFRKCGVSMPEMKLNSSARCREILEDAWKETKASARGVIAVARLDEVFQDISDIATSKTDPRRVIAEMSEHCGTDIQLPAESADWNNWELSAWIFANKEQAAWNMFVNIMAAEQTSLQKRWFEYRGLEGRVPDLSDGNLKEIGSIIADFFWEEKRSEVCSMEYYRKDENQYYFFGEIDDSLEYDEQKQPGEASFEVKAVVHPYRVIFAFNTATGEFAVSSAKLRLTQADELAKCLVQRLLGSLRGMRHVCTKSNDLKKLACHEHIFENCRNTVVTRVYLNEVKFFSKTFPNIMIAFNHRQHGSVAQAIRDFAEMNSQGLDALRFQEVGLGIEYRNSYKTESFTFRITENDTTLRNQPEHRRNIGKAVLEDLGVQSA